MSRWIVTTIPAWLLFAGLIVVIAGGAVLLQRYIRRRFPILTGDEHNDVTKFAYGFIGFVYAFFIGFVVSAMWGQINTADGNARTEGAVAVQMARNLDAFDTLDRDRLRQSLLAYTDAAVAEWTEAGASRSPDADRALAGLRAAYRQVQPSTEAQKTALTASNADLDTISQARTVRVLTARADTGPPWALWAVILLTSAMVLGTVIIYGVEKPAMHYPMVAIVGTIVAANLYLVLQLSHPYLGEIGTTSDPLQEVARVLAQPSP